MLAVSDDQVVEMVNVALQVFDKEGSPLTSPRGKTRSIMMERSNVDKKHLLTQSPPAPLPASSVGTCLCSVMSAMEISLVSQYT